MLDDFTIGLHAEIGEAQVRLSAFSTHHGSAASTAGNAVTKASMAAPKRIAFECISPRHAAKGCRATLWPSRKWPQDLPARVGAAVDAISPQVVVPLVCGQ